MNLEILELPKGNSVIVKQEPKGNSVIVKQEPKGNSVIVKLSAFENLLDRPVHILQDGLFYWPGGWETVVGNPLVYLPKSVSYIF